VEKLASAGEDHDSTQQDKGIEVRLYTPHKGLYR
jgi:hypothetical protein